MTELKDKKNRWQSLEASRPIDDARADLVVLYLEQRRRALITELRATEELLGWPQSIPAKSRG